MPFYQHYWVIQNCFCSIYSVRRNNWRVLGFLHGFLVLSDNHVRQEYLLPCVHTQGNKYSCFHYYFVADTINGHCLGVCLMCDLWDILLTISTAAWKHLLNVSQDFSYLYMVTTDARTWSLYALPIISAFLSTVIQNCSCSIYSVRRNTWRELWVLWEFSCFKC